jgi:hypothetical protein
MARKRTLATSPVRNGEFQGIDLDALGERVCEILQNDGSVFDLLYHEVIDVVLNGGRLSDDLTEKVKQELLEQWSDLKADENVKYLFHSSQFMVDSAMHVLKKELTSP